MTDYQSLKFRQALINSLVELEDTNTVASHFSDYITQAVERVCRTSTSTNRAKSNGAPWFDKECRNKRDLAIQAGHNVECAEDRQMQIEACRDYRAHKKMREIQYYNNCVVQIVDTYVSNWYKLWKNNWKPIEITLSTRRSLRRRIPPAFQGHVRQSDR